MDWLIHVVPTLVGTPSTGNGRYSTDPVDWLIHVAPTLVGTPSTGKGRYSINPVDWLIHVVPTLVGTPSTSKGRYSADPEDWLVHIVPFCGAVSLILLHKTLRVNYILGTLDGLVRMKTRLVSLH